MSRTGQLNYERWAKWGFLLGVTLFLIGVGGEWAVHSWLSEVPAWEETLFFDLEVIGLVMFFVSPIIFGIFLPLLE